METVPKSKMVRTPAIDRDYETCKVNTPKPPRSFIRQCSTPIVRLKKVRNSILNIKTNTVAGMVNLFNRTNRSSSTEESPISVCQKDYESEEKNRSGNHEIISSKHNTSPIKNYIKYFNELSSIKQTSVNGEDSMLNSQDGAENDFDSKESRMRQRSQSCNTQSMRNQFNILESYAKYPNFKLTHLKYFGVDPEAYLSSHGVNVTADLEKELTSPTMRIRSKSFAGKIMSKPNGISVKYTDYPNFKLTYLSYFGVEQKDYLLRYSSANISMDSDKSACLMNARNEMVTTNGFAGHEPMLKNVAGNSSTQKNVEQKTHPLNKTKSNFQTKSIKIYEERGSLVSFATILEEPQVEKPQVIKPKHPMKNFPLNSDYIAKLKLRLRQSADAPAKKLSKSTSNDDIGYPLRTSGMKRKFEKVDSVDSKDTEKGKDLTKLCTPKENKNSANKGMKNTGKMLSLVKSHSHK